MSSPEESPGPPGEVSSPAFVRLLEVQDHDTAIDQLRHRRASLPERARFVAVQSELAGLRQRADEARTRRDELAGRQGTLEQQIEASRTRRSQLERRLFDGHVTDPRDLQAMDDEVKHLARHISELEDREIEVMELIEPVEGELQAADVERDGLEAESQRLRAVIAEDESTLDAGIAAESEARVEVAAEVPADLLGRYERLRSKLGGTGAARLVGTSCGGCHLVLPAMEVDRIRKAPPDALITCDQCGRILVR